MASDNDPRWLAALAAFDRAGSVSSGVGDEGGGGAGEAGDGSAGAPQVIRDGLSLLVRRGGLLARVRDAAGLADAQREVSAARALAQAGIPAVQLIDGPDQPWAFGNHVVTVWRWLETAAPATASDVGKLAGILITSGDSFEGLPPFEPFAAIVGALEPLPGDDEQAGFIRQRSADLAVRWAEVARQDPCGVGFVHGDLHEENVIVTAQGPVLADLELAGLGPCSYDVTPAVVAVTRYGAPSGSLDEFLAARGHDPRGWEGFDLCLAVYELWVTAWAVGVRDRSPQWAAEADRRVESLRDGTPHRWVLA